MTNSYKIENDIPLPSTAKRDGGFPFGEMEIGSSFVIPGLEAEKCRNYASRYGKMNHKKFTVRERVGFYRCWRVE